MSIDPYFLSRLPFQTHPDILSLEATPPPLTTGLSSEPASSLETNESFQYASCPHCRSQRARLNKSTSVHKTFFSITCFYCGYSDNDVCDY